MAHTCHAFEYAERTKPEMFMCRNHWFALPIALRRLIWRTYRPGQCDDWHISKAYAEAAKNCIRYVANQEKKAIPENCRELALYDRLSGE